MSKKFLTSGLWLLTSVATFGLGWMLKPAQQSSAAVSTSTGPQTTSLTPSKRSASVKTPVTPTERGAAAIAKYVVGGKMTSKNMESAIAAMRKENDPLKRAAMFTALLNQLSPENAKAAFLALREGNGRGGFGRGGFDRGGGDQTRLLLNAWGRIDGANAITELTAMAEAERAERGDEGGRGGRGGGGRSTFDMYSVLTGWATEDAASATDFVNGVEDERQKGMLTAGIVSGLMVNGVGDAVDFVATLPADDRNRDRYMSSIANEVLEDGAAAGAKWVDTLAGDLREGAMEQVAERYVREDLEAAKAWVTEYADQDYAQDAVTEVAGRWAEKDPQAVIEWADELSGDTQLSVFEEALDEWTERDAAGASEYLAQMQDSPVKDAAVEGFAKELADDDPQSAAAWASTITNPELRMDTMQDVARDWYREDQAAALQWMETNAFSEEAVQSVTAERGRDGFDRRGFGGRGR